MPHTKATPPLRPTTFFGWVGFLTFEIVAGVLVLAGVAMLAMFVAILVAATVYNVLNLLFVGVIGSAL